MIPRIINALYDHLVERLAFYLDEMAVFPRDKFETTVTTSGIHRALVTHV
jgi:hypothetical protein